MADIAAPRPTNCAVGVVMGAGDGVPRYDTAYDVSPTPLSRPWHTPFCVLCQDCRGWLEVQCCFTCQLIR